MKTIFKKLLVICAMILAVFATSNLASNTPAFAATDNNTSNGNCEFLLGFTPWNCNVNEWSGNDSIKANILMICFNVLTDITVLAAYLVIGYSIYGGYLYILSSGDPTKVTNGKKTLIHAFTGLAIVLLANVIMNTIRIALGGNLSNCATGECVDNPTAMVENAINWVIGTSGVVALVFIFIGGISYMTSAGDATKVQKAKKTILYAAVGLAIVALSLTISAFVTNTINSSKTPTTSYNQTIKEHYG